MSEDITIHGDMGGGEPPAPPTRTRFGGLIVVIVRWWAILGGVLTLGLAIMTAGSALSNVFFQRPFPADYELVKHIIAVAIFMFLPYCQITGSNITVDIFTAGMSERAKQAMVAFSSLFGLAFSILMFIQMYQGLQSYIRFKEITPVLKLPLWTAFPPILASLALLAAACCITLIAGWRGFRNPTPDSGVTAP